MADRGAVGTVMVVPSGSVSGVPAVSAIDGPPLGRWPVTVGEQYCARAAGDHIERLQRLAARRVRLRQVQRVRIAAARESRRRSAAG